MYSGISWFLFTFSTSNVEHLILKTTTVTAVYYKIRIFPSISSHLNSVIMGLWSNSVGFCPPLSLYSLMGQVTVLSNPDRKWKRRGKMGKQRMGFCPSRIPLVKLHVWCGWGTVPDKFRQAEISI